MSTHSVTIIEIGEVRPHQNAERLEIVPVNSGKKRIVVRAIDRGPGIPNLEEVLSGRYRSKTGLGRGLLGTKRLADRFDITSTISGTHVVAEIAVFVAAPAWMRRFAAHDVLAASFALAAGFWNRFLRCC